MSDQKQPDWDKITEGKIRHGVAVAFIEQGQELNPGNMKTMEKWVQFIIHGYDGIKEVLEKSKEMTDKEVVEEVVKTFDGEVIKETDEEYINNAIQKAVFGLGQKDKNKVLYQLKQGNITLDNLDACLQKIGKMNSF